jgi:hypothetical protein
MAPSDATGILRQQPFDMPRPPVLPVDELIAGLRGLAMNTTITPPSGRLDITP